MPVISQPAVIVYTRDASPATRVATQLLAGAGFAIVTVRTSEELSLAAARGRVELLIIGRDSTDPLASELDRLALLPASQKPREVVLLVEDDRDDIQLKRKLPGVRVHVLATPLQAYGLLNIAARIRGRLHQHN